jgi:hypothetical protein
MNKEFIIVIYKLKAKISRKEEEKEIKKNITEKSFQPKKKTFQVFFFFLKSKQLTNTSTQSKKKPEKERKKNQNITKKKFSTKRKFLKPFSQIP